jgi:hypothetical protein
MSPGLSYPKGMSEVARVSTSQQSSIDTLREIQQVVSPVGAATGSVHIGWKLLSGDQQRIS